MNRWPWAVSSLADTIPSPFIPTDPESLQVTLMAGLHHPHIVRLLGYCEEYNKETFLVEQLLVYELMPNGDLEAFVEKSTFQI